MAPEEWKDLKGYEGIYQISNLGRIRNRFGKIRASHKRPDGYIQITLCKNKKIETRRIHQLVAQTFIPNPDNLPQINHKDEDKTNNNVNNLEWCECKYNINYR